MENLGKGAVRSPEDKRDFQLAFIASSPQPVVWGGPLNRPEPPDTNQGSSDVCTCETVSSAKWTLTSVKWAVRSVFPYIALTYGAYLRDAFKWVVNQGQQPFVEIPDPNPMTMQNMRSKTGLSPESAAQHKSQLFFSTNGHSIEQVAQAIRDFKHVGFGLDISSEGWQDYTYPRPPIPEKEETEGHALCGFDYHLDNGVKCIIAKSSWCGSQPGHHIHHIKENYFNSQSMFNEAYVLVERNNLITRYIVAKGGKRGVLVSVDGDGIFTDTIFWAKSEEMFIDLKKQYEVPDSAPIINYPI